MRAVEGNIAGAVPRRQYSLEGDTTTAAPRSYLLDGNTGKVTHRMQCHEGIVTKVSQMRPQGGSAVESAP